MKKILFVVPSLNIGGVEKAFIKLIKLIDRKDYEIYLKVLCQERRIL